jgi:hypothetical protein
MVKNLLAVGRGTPLSGSSTSTSNAILPPGSRIILSSQSATILDNLRKDLERDSILDTTRFEFRYAITQFPTLRDDDVCMVLLTNQIEGPRLTFVFDF